VRVGFFQSERIKELVKELGLGARCSIVNREEEGNGTILEPTDF